jgi:hypothetical protein
VNYTIVPEPAAACGFAGLTALMMLLARRRRL